MFECRNLVKRFGETVALDGTSFSIPEGRLTVLIGPSGCGKSTTLRILNRLIEPDGGEVLYRGRPLSSYDPVELRRSMGYVIQHIGLFPHWTVERNICTVPRLLGWPPERQRARALELLELVGLPPEEYARKMPHQLSGGEAQRVGVARALAADPPVILMDEPFGAADPLTRSRLQEEFLAIQRRLRKTVVFVTHDMGEAIRLGDRIILMREGRVVREATTEDLVRSGDGFVKTFLGSESVLLLLECHTMEEIARPEPSTIPEELPRVPGAATVKEGLSLLLESGAPMLAVEEQGGILGIAGIQEIQALVRRGR